MQQQRLLHRDSPVPGPGSGPVPGPGSRARARAPGISSGVEGGPAQSKEDHSRVEEGPAESKVQQSRRSSKSEQQPAAPRRSSRVEGRSHLNLNDQELSVGDAIRTGRTGPASDVVVRETATATTTATRTRATATTTATTTATRTRPTYHHRHRRRRSLPLFSAAVRAPRRPPQRRDHGPPPPQRRCLWRRTAAQS